MSGLRLTASIGDRRHYGLCAELAGRHRVRGAAEGGRRAGGGQGFGSVESVKAVCDLFSPVSGTVTAVNEELKDAPEKINADATRPGC